MDNKLKEKAKTKKLTGNRGLDINWREVLFRPSQLAGFKDEPTSFIKPLPSIKSEFFVLNPLKNLNTASDVNVAAFQNIMFELDWRGLACQEKHVESVIGLPFTMKTYSGGKSLHYIISLEDAVTLPEWRDMVHFLLYVVKHADAQCKNPARLTRTPNIFRQSTQRCQTLIHCEPTPIPTAQFKDFLSTGVMANYRTAYDLAIEIKKAERAAQAIRSRELGEPPEWVQRVLNDPTNNVYQGSRHATIVNVAVTLRSLGFDLESYIEPRLIELASKLDKSEQEVYSIMSWVERNVQIANIEG